MDRPRGPAWERDEGTLKIKCGFILIRVKPFGVVTKCLNPGYLFTVNGEVSDKDYGSEEEAQRAALEHARTMLTAALELVCSANMEP